MTVLVDIQKVSKRFGAVQALNNVSISINQGSIHALVGENGAGKSTLGKVVSGVIRPDKGQLWVSGKQVHYTSPHDALQDGITTITQEIALLQKQKVWHNVMLGQEQARFGFLKNKAMLKNCESLLELTHFDIDPNAKVASLNLADQKKVEVLQAIARNARVIIMDEPTAMLSDEETIVFLDVVRQLQAAGRTIIYVSHFLDEVLNLADTITVMRNGEVVRTSSSHHETTETLVEGMLGKPMAQMYPPKAFPPQDAPVVFNVKRLKTEIFEDITLQAKAGEIVGLAGLVGSGRSRLVRTLFGAEKIHDYYIEINGNHVNIYNTSDAIKAGLFLLPESRKEQGLTLKQSVRHNLSLAQLNHVSYPLGVLKHKNERKRVHEIMDALNINPAAPGQQISSLSGGNQQKVLFGKWLFEHPTVFMIDEPTRGIDVGAKQAIYELITGLAKEGMAILMVSSEIEEILGLAHRVLVMRLGNIVAEIDGRSDEFNETDIMRKAFGTTRAEA